MGIEKVPSTVSFVNVTVEENDIESGALEVLRVIRSGWPLDQIRFKLLTDGITNKLLACKLEGSEDEDTVLVRVYGNKTDMIIDRTAETRNIILLNKVGLAPDLYASFKNGLAYQFIPGCTTNTETVIEPKIYRLVAERLAKLHKVRVDGVVPSTPILWETLRKFLDLVPEVFTDPAKHKRYKEIVIPKDKIAREISELQIILGKIESPIVFAHNDLLLANIIYNEKEETVSFIDFEYAGFNYQAFDIGNHFAEFAGVDEVDYSRYPSKDLQMDWLKTYLTELHNSEPTHREVEMLYVNVNKFMLISHILWGVWALIQAEHSDINFDYISYAALRFNEYFLKKHVYLPLEPSS